MRNYRLLLLILMMIPTVSQAESPFKVEAPATEEGVFPFRFSHRAMGSEFIFDIYPREGDVGYDDIAPMAKEAFELIDSLEKQISSWISSSDTSQINRLAAKSPIQVHEDVFDLLTFSAQVNKETQGVFDITVAPLIELWNTALMQGKHPTPSEIADVLTHVGMNKVKLNPETREVSVQKAGVRLSFGGIGKGLALDIVADYFKSQDIKSALLSGGNSSILTIGAPPGKEFWIIGINNPYNKEESLESIRLRDQALSTSACYHHLAGVTGRPCGIFDPRTGQRATGLVSATVIAQSGMQTDALSTSFYVMGVEEVRAYCKQHPEVSAVLVENPADDELRLTHINR